MTGKRLFIALMPDEAVRAQLLAAAKDLAIRTNPQRKRVLPPENYHLTLQFLGDGISPEQEAAVRQALTLVRGSPFEMVIDHARSFGDLQGAWWLGLRTVPPELEALRGEVLRRTGSVGISGDRRFTPHVTIMRVPVKLPPTRTAPVTWAVDTFALVSSTLAPEHSRYEIVEQWVLKPGVRSTENEQISLL